MNKWQRKNHNKQIMRYTAGQSIGEKIPYSHCFPSDDEGLFLSHVKLLAEQQATLGVMVWNIFKQNRNDWLAILNAYKEKASLMLLQEAQTSQELIHFVTSHYLYADQVPAISLPRKISGVMTLSKAVPCYHYPLKVREPFLRAAKSSLVTLYPLDQQQVIMIINVHAINFSLGIQSYARQLAEIAKQSQLHNGPMIIAGDFNAWSSRRADLLEQFAKKLQLQEVRFQHDWRKKAFNRPLDFIFYRGISPVKAEVIRTLASDHNPLYVEFKVAS